MTAVRLQLSRPPGFDLQAASRARNGLGAVSVAQPSRWGNPLRAAPAITTADGVRIPAVTAEECARTNGDVLRRRLESHPAWTRSVLAALRGRNVACWCALDRPCHGDELLRLVAEVCP